MDSAFLFIDGPNQRSQRNNECRPIYPTSTAKRGDSCMECGQTSHPFPPDWLALCLEVNEEDLLDEREDEGVLGFI